MSGKALVLIDPRGIAGRFGRTFEFEFTSPPRDAGERARWLAEIAPQITAAVAIGGRGLPADVMAAATRLKLISCFGAGYDAFDPQALRARGIALTNCSDINNDDVADVAMGLLLSTARGIAEGDRLVRAGKFRDAVAVPLRPRVGGRRLGIVGLGAIGLSVARRAAAFGLDIAWTSPNPKPEAPYTYIPGLRDLAAWADFLCVCVRAGKSTENLIDAGVIEALGPKGTLINISRGSVVDEDALIAALKAGRLAGAGLDVFQQEPTPAERWADVPNVTLTPHIAGGTLESFRESAALVGDNLDRHFAGAPLLNVVN